MNIIAFPVRFSICGLLMLLFMAGMVSAQEPADNIRSLDQLKKNAVTIEDQSQFQVARQLMKRGAYISAADLLEQLYSENPDNVEILNNLLNCYLELKAYPKAEMLLNNRIETSPFEYGFRSRLIRLYLQTGQDSLARVQVEATIETFPGNPDIYRSVVSDLVNSNYHDMALDYIISGREQFESENMMVMEAARIFETRREYDAAVHEYFKALSGDTNMVRQAERRLGMLIRYPDAPAVVAAAMKNILDSLPGNEYALKFLQQAYIKNDQFAEAFDISRRLDSLGGNDGNVVFSYMRQCHDRKLYDQVIITAEYLDQLKIEDKPYGDYKFYYAVALAGVGRYDDALGVYGDIYETYPTRRDKAEALLHIGHIYRYDLIDYETALIYYDSVAYYYLIGPINLEAWYEIGLLHLVEADLDSAAIIFGRLVEEYRAIEDKERAEYQLAMIQFYRKDFEEANLAFRRLIAQYPHGYYVNDALINSLIISEAQLTFPDALTDYAEAIYCRARLQPDSMATKFGQIIDQGLSTLVGLATYRLAEYRVETADTAAAMTLIDNMENLYPDDYFYPYCLKMKADIRQQQGDAEAASQIYRLILEEYNRYPFTGEVRTRLQEIEAKIPTS